MNEEREGFEDTKKRKQTMKDKKVVTKQLTRASLRNEQRFTTIHYMEDRH
jgi:hypothetical protein